MFNKIRAIIITIVLVFSANLVLSYAATFPLFPSSPRPKADNTLLQSSKELKATFPLFPSSPRPKATFPLLPSSPRP